MNRYFPFLISPTFFGGLENQGQALVYWMPVSCRGALRAEFPVAQATIKEVAYPQPNWDGYGALAISAEAKDNALNAIQGLLQVAPTPEINPNPNGTLSFEWESGEGKAHLEIGQTQYSFYVNPRVGVPVLFEGPATDVNRLHGSLVASFLFPPIAASGTATPIRYGTDV